MERYDKPLFTTNNAKIRKGITKGYFPIVLHLSPADMAFRELGVKGTLCSCSTAECRSLCLNTSGMGNYPSVQQGRINKTLFYLSNQYEFMIRLHTEIESYRRKAEKLGLILTIRLNGTSDIKWENLLVGDSDLSLFESFPDSIFYDYTKHPLESRTTVSNLHLTYSFNGKRGSLKRSLRYLARGQNIAFVYDGVMPDQWHGFPVYSGDDDDLRFRDPVGHAIGLKAKGKARGKADSFDFVGVYA